MLQVIILELPNTESLPGLINSFGIDSIFQLIPIPRNFDSDSDSDSSISE